jgi:hypothetical protein
MIEQNEYQKLLFEKMALETLMKFHTEFQLMPSKEYKQYIDDALERYKQILELLKKIENE